MPSLILNRAQVRDVDRRAITEYGLAGVVLMENAGRGATELLCQQGCRGPVVILAGKGNNGGDGFVMARHLALRGIPTHLILCCRATDLQGDAAINYRVLHRAGLAGTELDLEGGSPAITNFLTPLLQDADWIVDALLGTGAQGSVREPYHSVIEAINMAHRRVLSVDLPSGLDCDTGMPCGVCVRATLTATFVALKPGFLVAGADHWTGRVEVIDIGVPPRLIDEATQDLPAARASIQSRPNVA